MPNIVQQIVGPLGEFATNGDPQQVGIYIRASNGAEVTLTMAQARNVYTSTAGTKRQKVAAVISAAKTAIRNALGVAMIDVNQMVFDTDLDLGDVKDLVVG